MATVHLLNEARVIATCRLHNFRALDWVLEPLDTGKIAIAGHSMGGLAASLGVERDRRFKVGIILDVHDGEVPDAVVKATATPVLILASGRKQ